MAGMICPHCGGFTFFQSTSGRKCSKCGYEMILPPNEGKGDRGKKCPNCKKYQVFGDKCKNCGAKFITPKEE